MNLHLDRNANATIAGGSIGRVDLDSNTLLEIQGDDFRVDDVPLFGLNSPGDQITLSVPEGSLLSGVLTDGTPFVITSTDWDDFDDGEILLSVAEVVAPSPANINVPGDPSPQGVRGGQTLTVTDGGHLPSHFVAGPGATVHIGTGASVGQNLEAHHSLVEITGGTVGEFLDVFNGATVRVTGGTIGDRVQAHQGGVLQLLGGVAEGDVDIQDAEVRVANDAVVERLDLGGASSLVMDGGTVRFLLLADSSAATIHGGVIEGRSYFSGTNATIHGGIFQDDLALREGSAVTVRGGLYEQEFEVSGEATLAGGSFGAQLSLSTTGSLTFEGDHFYVNGVPIEELPAGNELILPFGDATVLSGTFASGTPFGFSPLDGDSLVGRIVRLRRTPVANDPQMFNLPSDPVPLGVSAEQVLVAGDGAVVGNHFNAGFGSRVIVKANATVGDNFEAAGAVVEINGGSIGAGLDAFPGSSVTLNSGEIGNSASVYDGAQLLVDGGTVGDFLQVFPGGRVEVQSGMVGEQMRVRDGGLLVVSGGEIGERLTIETGGLVSMTAGSIGQSIDVRNEGTLLLAGGALFDESVSSDLDLDPGANLILAATRFELDNIDITDTLTLGVDTEINDRNVPLLVEFSDGTTFTFSLSTQGGTPRDFYHPSASVLLRLVTPGDFDFNGSVDGADFLNWQRTDGTHSNLLSWKENYGNPGSPQNPLAIPEPQSLLLSIICIMSTLAARSHRIDR